MFTNDPMTLAEALSTSHADQPLAPETKRSAEDALDSRLGKKARPATTESSESSSIHVPSSETSFYKSCAIPATIPDRYSSNAQCALSKEELQTTLARVEMDYTARFEAQKEMFLSRLAEQEDRWKSRARLAELEWDQRFSKEKLGREQDRSKALQMEMDLRQRLGRLEGALAMLMRQNQGCADLPTLTYHERSALGQAPEAGSSKPRQTRGNLEQTLTAHWSQEDAMDDLYDKSKEKGSLVGSRASTIQVPPGAESKMMINFGMDQAHSTPAGGTSDQHHHLGPFVDEDIVPTVSPLVILHPRFSDEIEPSRLWDSDCDSLAATPPPRKPFPARHIHPNPSPDAFSATSHPRTHGYLCPPPSPRLHVSKKASSSTLALSGFLANHNTAVGPTNNQDLSAPSDFSLSRISPSVAVYTPYLRDSEMLLPASDGIRRQKSRWPPKKPYSAVGTMQEIVCDWCLGRCHWCCAGLSETVDMSRRSWTCFDCRHLAKVRGLTKESAQPTQQARCVRFNCILLDDIKPSSIPQEEVFVVERLIGRRIVVGAKALETQWLVKWANYGLAECSWENRKNLKPHDKKLIKDFMDAADSEKLDVYPSLVLLGEAKSNWCGRTGELL